jgi:hypothetical protein
MRSNPYADPDRRSVPTYYDVTGTWYRSKLEAQWAVFFHHLGVTATYEPKRFDTTIGNYTPDFWIGEWKMWIEIKPCRPDRFEAGRNTLRKLARIINRNKHRRALVIWGKPAFSEYKVAFFGNGDMARSCKVGWRFVQERSKPHITYLVCTGMNPICLDAVKGGIPIDREPISAICSSRIRLALSNAQLGPPLTRNYKCLCQ